MVEQHAPLVVANVEAPSLNVGQVLVKTAFSGICGKQLDEINGTRGDDPFLPHLLGHEGGGVVIDVGAGVRKVKAGDHVVMHWMKGSGIDSATPVYTRDGGAVNAGWVTTFNEYAVVSENRVTPIPHDVGLDAASLLGCAVTTGLGIVFNDAQIKPGQSIAVFGAGGVGLNVIHGADLVNAHPIVAIDLHEDKLERAIDFGATHTLKGGTADLRRLLMELSGGRGFDVTVDTSGNTDVFQTAYETTSPSGKTVLAGVLHHKRPVTIDSFALHSGRQIIGSHGGNTNPDTDIPRYVRLYQLGKLKLDAQITHRFSLDAINEAVEVVELGKAGRCVISMS